MSVSVEKKSNIEYVIQVTVPYETVEQAMEKRFQQLAKTATVSGYRPGKVPVARLKQMQAYADGVQQEVAADLMRDHYMKAVEQEKVHACGYPSFDMPTLKKGEPLVFSATVEVYPEVALQSCKGHEVIRPTSDVSEKDIDTMLEKVREQHKTWEKVDRAAKEGDQVVMDFKGCKEGVPFEGGTAKDAKLILGSNQFIPGFEAGLEGTKAGESKTLSLKFPESYHQKDLAGQDVTFDVTVHAVEASVLPEVDDALAEKLNIKEGGVPALREHLSKHMSRELKQRIRQAVKSQAMDALAAVHVFEIPNALIESECRAMQKNMKERMLQQFGGQMDRKDFAKLPELPLEHFEEEAKKRVRLGLIMAAYSDEHQKEASEEAIEAFLTELVEPYEDPEKMKSWYKGNDDKMNEVKAMVMEQALVDWALTTAKVVDRAMPYEEAVAWRHDADQKEGDDAQS